MTTRLLLTVILALALASAAALAARSVEPPCARPPHAAAPVRAGLEIAPAEPMVLARARYRRGAMP